LVVEMPSLRIDVSENDVIAATDLPGMPQEAWAVFDGSRFTRIW